MARPSKLTEAQWGEVIRRAAQGETITALAKAYRVSKGTISERVSKRLETVKTLAGAISRSEQEFDALPISERIATRTLADQLKGIQNHYAKAAKDGAETAEILNGHALTVARELEGPTDIGRLKVVAALTETAKGAASLASNMIAASKGKDEGGSSMTLADLLGGEK